ncbi:hypothetical protein BpHYR1_025483 [Brachionus plicatilis]|uniref:Uncharacterized protein n=1 Tax=Brachionus plicatilis TaxID=10195 RepID=A0A3M7PB96_BRAPC|nr:hypothetical protein BpHYR1_025483 [Brachionus plicatilis]
MQPKKKNSPESKIINNNNKKHDFLLVNQTTQCHLDRVAKLEKRKFRFTAGVIVNDGTRFITQR